MSLRVAVFAVLLASCGGAVSHDDISLADAPMPVRGDATVRESGARDAGRADAPRESVSPVDTVGDASLSAEAAAACNVTPPSAGCPGSNSGGGWPDAAGHCDEAGVRTDCGRTGQPCCSGYCQGMQYCDQDDRCSPSCGHEGEPCCLISFGPCPECLGDLVCLSHDSSPTLIPTTTCSPRSACGADDAGYCLACGGNALPCCADAGCSIDQAEYCAGGTCFTPPSMR
jgi:hypothetical protein